MAQNKDQWNNHLGSYTHGHAHIDADKNVKFVKTTMHLTLKITGSGSDYVLTKSYAV